MIATPIEQHAADGEQSPIGQAAASTAARLVDASVERLAAGALAPLDPGGASSLGHMAAKNTGGGDGLRWHPICSG